MPRECTRQCYLAPAKFNCSPYGASPLFHKVDSKFETLPWNACVLTANMVKVLKADSSILCTSVSGSCMLSLKNMFHGQISRKMP